MCSFFPLLKKSIQRICITAGKINGACISITYIHMIDSVQLFNSDRVSSCFFHHIIQIIINRSAACNSSLNLPLAYQFIYVVAWLMVLNQNASLLHLMQVLFRFLINLRIIKVRLCRQIHLCSVYMEKRIRILFPNGCCLFSIHYIIWKGSYCSSVGLSALNARNTAIKSCSFPVACLKNHSSNLHAPYIRFKNVFSLFFFGFFQMPYPIFYHNQKALAIRLNIFEKAKFFVFFYCKLIYLCYYTYKENKNVVKTYSNN